MGKIVKNIRNLDHDDVNQICKNHQVEDATEPDGFACGEEKNVLCGEMGSATVIYLMI